MKKNEEINLKEMMSLFMYDQVQVLKYMQEIYSHIVTQNQRICELEKKQKIKKKEKKQ